MGDTVNFKNISFSVGESIATITINRLEKMNALNFSTLKEINTAIDMVYQDNEIKAVLITGAGDKSFVAGADIKELNQLSPGEAQQAAKNGQDLFTKI